MYLFTNVIYELKYSSPIDLDLTNKIEIQQSEFMLIEHPLS